MTRRDEISGAIVRAAEMIMKIPFDPHLAQVGEILGPLSSWATGKADAVRWAGYHYLWRVYGELDTLSGDALDLAVHHADQLRPPSRPCIELAAHLQALRVLAGFDQHSPRSGRAKLAAETLGLLCVTEPGYGGMDQARRIMGRWLKGVS